MKTKLPRPDAQAVAASDPRTPPITDSSIPVRRMASDAIFGSHNEIEIEHNGALYRLRKTSLGKLILTK